MSNGPRCHRIAELLLAGLLLAGCGPAAPGPVAAAGPAAPPSTAAGPAPTSTPVPDPSPDPSWAPTPAEAVRLPWPAADAATAAELQRSVDAGAQPWLLDPAEVAVSYAAAAHGWTQAAARPRPGGGTVEVADGSRKLTLSLAQPGRAGAGGIWVVTAESAG